MTSPRTLLEALIQKLHGFNVHSDAEESPVAILWTDPRSEWKPLLPLLRQQLPELLCLGDYSPEHQQGPALWLRCIVDRSLPAAAAAAGQIPVIYLPGISRQELRAGEGCPWALEPLIELMFRGSLWLQRNGRDWTLAAFLSSSDALGLDLAGDQGTKAALSRALAEVASVPLEQLRGKRLEAEDFNAYLVPDELNKGKRRPGFQGMPPVLGTGVMFSLDTSKPIDLASTWIASGSGVECLFLNQLTEFASDSGLDLASECIHTGGRAPAKLLRRKIQGLLPAMDGEPLSLDFSGVKSAASSFHDELLGRLAAEDPRGQAIFSGAVRIQGMTPRCCACTCSALPCGMTSTPIAVTLTFWWSSSCPVSTT